MHFCYDFFRKRFSILSGFRRLFFLISFFSLLILNSNFLFSQPVDIFSIRGHVFKWKYPCYQVDGITVTLQGPIGLPTEQTLVWTTNSTSYPGKLGFYNFLDLPAGHYHLWFNYDNLYGDFDTANYPGSALLSGGLGGKSSGMPSDSIQINLTTSDIYMDTIWAVGRLRTISGTVDTAGLHATTAIPGVWMRLAMTNYCGVTETYLAQTNGSGVFTFNNVDAAGSWVLRTRNGNPGTGDTSFVPFYISTPASGQRTYLNITGDQSGQNFRFSLNRYSIDGYVRLYGVTGVTGVTINLGGETSATASTTTNATGYYQFTNRPSNFKYAPYLIIPSHPDLEFDPDTITIASLMANSLNNNFYAKWKQHTISGTCYSAPGVTASNIKIVVDSFATGLGRYVPVDSMITDGTGTYTFSKSRTFNYRIRPVDIGVVPLLYYPEEKVFSPLIANQVQNFYSAACGPVLKSPVNASTNAPIVPTLVWNAAASGPPVDYYYVEVSTTTAFGTLVGGSPSPNLAHVGIPTADQSWTVTTPLDYGVTYYWRVKTGPADGNKCTDIWSFTTSLAPPVLVTPPDSSQTGYRPLYTWLAVAGATSYDFEVQLESDGLTGTPTVTGLPATNYQQPTDLIPFRWYVWTARAKNATSTSPWATHWHFYTGLLTPRLKYPPDSSENQPANLTLKWFGVQGATQYVLQYSTDSFFVYNTITLDVADTNKSVFGLDVDSTYYWRVKVKLPSETGWTNWWHFHIGRIFTWWPTFIDYGKLLLNKSAMNEVTFFNNSDAEVILSNIGFSDNINYTSPNRFEFPFTMPAHTTKKIFIQFSPLTTGIKNCLLRVHHNVGTEPQNPVLITLTGEGVKTFANINLPDVLDFGTVVLNTGVVEKEIEITNNSPVDGDNLIIDPTWFETPDGRYQVLTPLPASIPPGQTLKVKIGLNTDKLGTFPNDVHFPNSSANKPDASMQLKGRVVVGGLIVDPMSWDYGKTTKDQPFKTRKFTIWNASTRVITVFDKFLNLDTLNFTFTLNKPFPIAMQPNQIDTVEIMFFPANAGRKNANFAVKSDDSLAPIIYVPLTGFAGDQPMIWTNMQEIDFGSLRPDKFKDTILVIKNIGSLDLKIDLKSILGPFKDLFTFVDDGNPITLRSGDSERVTLRFTGKAPFGSKNADLHLYSNDPDKPDYVVKMYGRVRPNYLLKYIDRIIFDTLMIGYSQDSSFIIWNEGEIPAIIDDIFIDGPEAFSFTFENPGVPITVNPGDTLRIKVRFKPQKVGENASRIVIHCNDPLEPNLQVILLGWGKEPDGEMNLTGNGNSEGEEEIYFGRVPIFETRYAFLNIMNISKYSKLRIDSIYFTWFENQPFGHMVNKFPLFVQPLKLDSVKLKFHPVDKVRSYAGFVYVVYNDSLNPKSTDRTKRLKIRGDVIFPDMEFGLDPVLEFGKVLKDSSKIAYFLFRNKGEYILRVDSMILVGDDRGEFVINKHYPITIPRDSIDTCYVTFHAIRIGSKDARILVFSNDLFKIGLIKIWAECILNPNQTLVKDNKIPTEYILSQNYPNPFNPSTRIEYSIPEATNVTLKIYNSIGKEVETLVNTTQSPGNYSITWVSDKHPSGIYFYRIQTPKFSAMKKMLFLK